MSHGSLSLSPEQATGFPKVMQTLPGKAGVRAQLPFTSSTSPFLSRASLGGQVEDSQEAVLVATAGQDSQTS